MGPENNNGPVVAYMDGQPVEMAGETLQFTVAHMEGGEIVPDTPDISAGGVSVADITAAIGTMSKAWAAVSVVIEEAARAVRQIVRQLARAWEFQQAMKWAEAYNRPLANRYHHTKKKRTRKKYAKQILAWYWEEVRGCCD